MATEDIIMLSQQELVRLHIVHKIVNKELKHNVRRLRRYH